jgi:hypothetical protein
MKTVPIVIAEALIADRFSFEPALFFTAMVIPLAARKLAMPSP